MEELEYSGMLVPQYSKAAVLCSGLGSRMITS
jgi:hypothetical protein